ncbi:D-2-hydroxyacid dehydrogenase [Alsobacter sp. R-9]
MTTPSLLPPPSELLVGFAHVAYRMDLAFAGRDTGLRTVTATDAAGLARIIGDVDVLVVSGLWSNALLAQAPRLRYVQSFSAGTDQYDKDAFRARGIRLASGQGVNERAVAEHALSLMLALTRKLPEARDNQARAFWRPMIGDLGRREDQLGGKTLAIVGFGRIGQRVGRLAKAFDMRVIGLRRDAAPVPGAADEVWPMSRLFEALAQADVVVLTCPLTPETENLIDARALAAMRPGALLVNVARGKVVDDAALLDALASGRIAGAGLDVFREEPLPASSPWWTAPNVIVTPHTAGETRRYEENVADILLENLDRLWRGETELRNGIV